MYRESIELLKNHGVVFDKGLSQQELSMIEEIYGFSFPKSLRLFLSSVLPISKGFYNWRSLETENIELIKSVIRNPIDGIYKYADEVEWSDNWGDEPDRVEKLVAFVRDKLKTAPGLIPVFAHRYMPIDGNDNPIVLSIWGTDVICYGENLEEYFKIEFGEKDQNCIDFKNISHVSFWSDLM